MSHLVPTLLGRPCKQTQCRKTCHILVIVRTDDVKDRCILHPSYKDKNQCKHTVESEKMQIYYQFIIQIL